MRRAAVMVLAGMMAWCAPAAVKADPVLAGRILNPVTHAEPVSGTRDPAV